MGYLSLLSLFHKQELPRTPEPEMVTASEDAVEDYDQTANSPMAMLYLLNINLLKLLFKNQKNAISVIDLACGPGVFASWMALNLKIQEIRGVDLSAPMLEKTQQRFVHLDVSTAFSFSQSDITDLATIRTGSYDLVTCMSACHHLPSLKEVKAVFAEADRVCSSSGIVFVSDLVRPKSQNIFERYFNFIEQKNRQVGMTAHMIDFRNSLLASWTKQDLASCIPDKSLRSWYLLCPVGLEYTQILVGLPQGMDFPSLRAIKRQDFDKLVPPHLLFLWRLTFGSFKFGTKLNKLK